MYQVLFAILLFSALGSKSALAFSQQEKLCIVEASTKVPLIQGLKIMKMESEVASKQILDSYSLANVKILNKTANSGGKATEVSYVSLYTSLSNLNVVFHYLCGISQTGVVYVEPLGLE